MKKYVVFLALFVATNSAFAMIYFLTKEWSNKNGDQMCQYENGTVLNVGYRLCPLSIQG